METLELTQQEKIVLDGFIAAFKHYKIPLEIALPTRLALETPQQQQEMLKFFMDNYETGLTEGQVISKVEEILMNSELS